MFSRTQMFCLLAASSLAASTTFGANNASTEELKDYTLFTGLEVSVQLGGAPVTLQSVDGKTAHVVSDGASVTIPLSKLGDFYTRGTITVSDTRAELSDVAAEFTQSGGKNRMLQTTREQAGSAGMEFDQSRNMAHAELAVVNAVTDIQRYLVPRDMTPEQVAAENQQRASEEQMKSQATYDSLPESYLSPDRNDKHAGAPDIFQYRFRISARHRIENAFVVMLTSLWVPEDPTKPRQYVTVRELPAFDSNAKKITLHQRGIPPGAALKDVDIHIYADGRELATNLSEKTIELTRGQAFRYLLLDYLKRHAGEDVAPRPVTALIPHDFRIRVPEALLHRQVTATVGDDGRVLDADLLGPGEPEADAYVLSIVRDAYFYPQLAAGQPTESRQTYQLYEFLR